MILQHSSFGLRQVCQRIFTEGLRHCYTIAAGFTADANEITCLRCTHELPGQRRLAYQIQLWLRLGLICRRHRLIADNRRFSCSVCSSWCCWHFCHRCFCFIHCRGRFGCCFFLLWRCRYSRSSAYDVIVCSVFLCLGSVNTAFGFRRLSLLSRRGGNYSRLRSIIWQFLGCSCKAAACKAEHQRAD